MECVPDRCLVGVILGNTTVVEVTAKFLSMRSPILDVVIVMQDRRVEVRFCRDNVDVLVDCYETPEGRELARRLKSQDAIKTLIRVGTLGMEVNDTFEYIVDHAIHGTLIPYYLFDYISELDLSDVLDSAQTFHSGVV